MKERPAMRIKNSFLNVGGFVGLVGLLGFRYFATGDQIGRAHV